MSIPHGCQAGNSVFFGGRSTTFSGYTAKGENNRLKRDSSLARFKDKAQPLDEDFVKILRDTPQSFVDRDKGQEHIGFIAEELEHQ